MSNETDGKNSSTMTKEILGGNVLADGSRLVAMPREGAVPLEKDDLLNAPSGDLFGLVQNAGMGWTPEEVNRPGYLIVSTQGGLRAEDGTPIALGFHTGHWEIGLMVKEAAETLKAQGCLPYAVQVSDPCDGRSQGTFAMFDSLPYRNSAAITMRRLIRSLPTRKAVMGVGTCDKGLPAIMMALAGSSMLPGIILPGGVTLPALGAENAGEVQTIGSRFAQGEIDIDYASEMSCQACGSGGGGCQFLGTAATSQVVAEALGLCLPHSALSPSGEPVWLDIAHRSALCLVDQVANKRSISDVLTDKAIENAMLVHAAFGGSTNLLLHIPAVAYEAGLRLPSVDDWIRVNKRTPRLVDALPNGPKNHPTVEVFFAGAVPEVMLHLRDMNLLHLDAINVTGQSMDETLDWWKESERRSSFREALRQHGTDPDDVIMNVDEARTRGLSSTVVFPTGNISPEGSVVKSTAIDPKVVDADGVFRQTGPARVFCDERDAIAAVKGLTDPPIKEGDVMIMIGMGPSGTGMQETAQITSALKYLEWGKHVALLTDARFSGFSTGACIGHIGPEALAGGPISKVQDGDIIEIMIDRNKLVGSVNMVGTKDRTMSRSEVEKLLTDRPTNPNIKPHGALPDDTRLWAALQRASGGTWRGCIYDVDRIIDALID